MSKDECCDSLRAILNAATFSRSTNLAWIHRELKTLHLFFHSRCSRPTMQPFSLFLTPSSPHTSFLLPLPELNQNTPNNEGLGVVLTATLTNFLHHLWWRVDTAFRANVPPYYM